MRPDDGYRFFEWSEHPHDDWETGHAYQDWLKAKGVDEKPEWVDADDLAATEFDKQMLVEEGRLPKARSEFADGARGRKKAGSKDEPAA